MASEVQKPLAKLEFLLGYGQLATVSLEPCKLLRFRVSFGDTNLFCL